MPGIWDDDGDEKTDWRYVKTARNIIDRASDAKRSGRGLDSNLEAMVGLCAQCDNYVFIEDNMHAVVFSACRGLSYDTIVPMTKNKQIKNCSEFEQKGQMALQTMFSIATPIEPGEITPRRKTAGFTSDELKEKKDDENS